MKKQLALFGVLIIASLALTACGGRNSITLLDEIKSRGYILVSTDRNYAPQSLLIEEGKRPANTKCPIDALTTAEMRGFDVDVAKALGDSLAVETCFATPDWEAIIAGNWDAKWDISIGSVTVTSDRREVLNFSVPYYYTPAAVVVGRDSDFATLDDLAGQTLCAGTGTTYVTWLEGGDLGADIPVLAKAPTVTVITLDTDQECAQAVAYGRKEFVGYVTSVTVVYQNLSEGYPIRLLGGSVFLEPLAAAVDKASGASTDSLLTEVNKLLTKMHADGTLSSLSLKWFKDADGNGVDYTKPQ